MAEANLQNFDKRMEKILQKHQRLARGYVPAITEDGLIIAKPKRRIVWPWRSVLFLLVVGMGFKVWLYSSIGPEAYNAKVARLSTGTQVEVVGAWAMTADPVTVAAAEQLSLYLE